MADEEHSRWASSYDGNNDFVEAVDNGEKPSEMSDDDEKAEMSMDEISGGLKMDCLSDTKDKTRLLSLGDYLLIFTKLFEAIITQVAAAVLVEGFVEKNGVDWIVKNGVAGFGCEHILHSVGSIVKFVLQHVKSGDKLMLAIMEVFLTSIEPLAARSSRDHTDSNSGTFMLIPLGDEGMVAAITSMSNAVPILSMLTKNSAVSVPQTHGELRNRVWDAWLTDTGRRLHMRFRKVARVLSWDLFSTDVRAYHFDADRATLLASKKKRIMTFTVSTDLNVIKKTESADIAVVETDANDTY